MPRGDTLWDRLEAARLVELQKLAEIVSLREAKEKTREVLVEELSKEIRSAAGHFVFNLFRAPHDFPYKQMLIDVANKMAPGLTFLSWTDYKLSDAHTETDIEETIWKFFEGRLAERIRKLTPDSKERLKKDVEQELKGLGYSEALITQIGAGLLAAGAAGAVAPALAYSIALNTASGLALLKLWWLGGAGLAAILGTGAVLFAVMFAPAFAWWLGNTAYRKTIPATLCLIQIRKLREIEDTLP
jgi:uncharacterized protein YaaW (UPF0174 family)